MNLERLKELMSKATPLPWKEDIISLNYKDCRDTDCDCGPNIRYEDRDLIMPAINSLPDLIRKAEAGEKLAKEIKDIDGTEYCGHQLDLALAAYDAMVKGE